MVTYDEHRAESGTPTNAARARFVKDLIQPYVETGTEDYETALVDLIADLHHFVHQELPGKGFLGFVGSAANHFCAEIDEEVRIATT